MGDKDYKVRFAYFDVTLIVITSPSPSNPSIEMINKVIDSFTVNIEGLLDCAVIIVADGYKISDYDRTKKGSIIIFIFNSLNDNLKVE